MQISSKQGLLQSSDERTVWVSEGSSWPTKKLKLKHQELVATKHCQVGSWPVCLLLREIISVGVELASIMIEYAFEDELEDFLNEYDLSRSQNSRREVIMTYGSAFVARFLDGVGVLKPLHVVPKFEYHRRFKDFRVTIREHVSVILWYRMALYGYDSPEVGCFQRENKYPVLPADVVGILKNGDYFYYKDGHPHLYGHSGRTHEKWIYLTKPSLRDLLMTMDLQDVRAFLRRDTQWTPLELSRCKCSHCFQMWIDLPSLRLKYPPRMHSTQSSLQWYSCLSEPVFDVLACSDAEDCCFFCAMLARNEFEPIPKVLAAGGDCYLVLKRAECLSWHTKKSLDQFYELLAIMDRHRDVLRGVLQTVFIVDVVVVVSSFVFGDIADMLRLSFARDYDLDCFL